MRRIVLTFLFLGILLLGSVFALTLQQTATVNVVAGGINIYSPIQDKIYNTRQVPINFSMSSAVDCFRYSQDGKEFITLCRNCSGNKGNFKMICKSCDEYGFAKIKRKGFDEGLNQLVILGSFEMGDVEEQINFTVDSKKPIISGTEPKRNQATNGSFSIKYTEANVKQIILGGNKTEDVTSQCTESGERVTCNVNVDLSTFDGKEIMYWFNITDIAENMDSSKPIKVLVDTISPVLTVNSPDTELTYGRKVSFNLSVSEEVTLEFIDNSAPNPKWQNLCSNCNSYGLDRIKAKSLNKGTHDLIIKSTDEAGNSDSEAVSFNVAY